MKNVLILNGAPKRNGNTAALIGAFSEGAESAGHRVRAFYLNGMDIRGCLDCQGCREARTGNPCVQKDDMAEVYEAYAESDVVVLASPVYFWAFTGQLKSAIDRLYAYVFWQRGGGKETVLLMSAGGDERQFAQIAAWHENFERYLGWTRRGEVLAVGKVGKAVVEAWELAAHL